MIDTQAIRKKVLDLALQGKLTEQRPEDGTADEILSEIQQVRILLEKSGRIKAISPMPIIQKEETPFVLPNGWACIIFVPIFQINLNSRKALLLTALIIKADKLM